MSKRDRWEWFLYYVSAGDLSPAGYAVYSDSDYRVYTRVNDRGTVYRISLNGNWCSDILPSLVAVDEWLISKMEAD